MDIVRRTDIDGFADRRIEPHVDAFKQYLNQRRYDAKAVATYLLCVTHFAHWADSGPCRRCRIDDGLIAAFLDEHLLPCKCAGALHHDRGDHRAALGHLLAVLHARGVIAVPTVSATPVDEELRRYGEYMERVRGLAPKTRSIALRIIARLLTARFGEGPVDVAAIKPEHVRRFFAGQAKLYSKPANAGSVVAALRGYQNKRVLYDLLFRASAGTLRTIAADPKHLGAEIGFITILHTWGQNLLHHPHVHCVVPGGGISPDGERWIACRPGFFLPVRVLSRLFRRLFLEQLRRAFDAGMLRLHGQLQ
jgi:integrase/recombinase XerC